MKHTLAFLWHLGCTAHSVSFCLYSFLFELVTEKRAPLVSADCRTAQGSKKSVGEGSVKRRRKKKKELKWFNSVWRLSVRNNLTRSLISCHPGNTVGGTANGHLALTSRRPKFSKQNREWQTAGCDVTEKLREKKEREREGWCQWAPLSPFISVLRDWEREKREMNDNLFVFVF